MNKDEYIIINKTAILKRIKELESACLELFNLVHDSEGRIEYKIRANELYDIMKHKEIKSTPLIPEIEKAIQFGKDIRSEKSFINPNFDSPFVDYEDSTEETITYISNLKLDI